MAVTASNTVFYSSGAISFSSLRSNFKEVTSGAISASELRRNTSTSNANPIVPDATENSSISTLNNLNLSQFRNSIKYYNLIQYNTDENLVIHNLFWNSNLTKNIKKRIIISGICGSRFTSAYAATFNASAYNLTIDISKSVYGAGGDGGTSTTISGSSGGPALYVSSSSGSVNVFVGSSGQLYGGGGGGERGGTGANGASGTCYTARTVTERYTTGRQCRSCPGCASGWYAIDCYQRQGRCDWRGQYRQTVCERQYTVYDPYSVPGAPGGAGGDGGLGRGYNNPNSTLGKLGSPGTAGGCPYYGGSGNTGETGGSGGEWGLAGGSTNNVGSGGSPGRAITGSNYTVSGTLTGIKGLY